MKELKRWFFVVPLMWLLSMSLAFAPAAAAHSRSQPEFTQYELDQMLAPIALYPDSLLSQILMAATYPAEVEEAARWSRGHPGLDGDRAVRAVQYMDWDPSVKSLVAFPQILDMMDEKIDWTQRLGDAFLAQESDVMAAVQDLRDRAYQAGNLRSNEYVRVVPQSRVIVVETLNPRVVYVPYYDPFVVYGPWRWAAYPPVHWAPWRGYDVRPAVWRGFAWGPAINVSAGFFFGGCDWHARRVNVVHVNNYYYTRTVVVNRTPDTPRAVATVAATPGHWRHDPDRRRGVSYRTQAVPGEAARRQPAATVQAAPQKQDSAPAQEIRRVRDQRPEERNVMPQRRDDVADGRKRDSERDNGRREAHDGAPTPADTRVRRDASERKEADTRGRNDAPREARSTPASPAVVPQTQGEARNVNGAPRPQEARAQPQVETRNGRHEAGGRDDARPKVPAAAPASPEAAPAWAGRGRDKDSKGSESRGAQPHATPDVARNPTRDARPAATPIPAPQPAAQKPVAAVQPAAPLAVEPKPAARAPAEAPRAAVQPRAIPPAAAPQAVTERNRGRPGPQPAHNGESGPTHMKR